MAPRRHSSNCWAAKPCRKKSARNAPKFAPSAPPKPGRPWKKRKLQPRLRAKNLPPPVNPKAHSRAYILTGIAAKTFSKRIFSGALSFVDGCLILGCLLRFSKAQEVGILVVGDNEKIPPLSGELIKRDWAREIHLALLLQRLQVVHFNMTGLVFDTNQRPIMRN